MGWEINKMHFNYELSIGLKCHWGLISLFFSAISLAHNINAWSLVFSHQIWVFIFNYDSCVRTGCRMEQHYTTLFKYINISNIGKYRIAIIYKPVKWIKSNRIFSRKTDENQVNPGSMACWNNKWVRSDNDIVTYHIPAQCTLRNRHKRRQQEHFFRLSWPRKLLDINHYRQQDDNKNIMEVFLGLVNFYDINHRRQQDNIKNIMEVYLGLVYFYDISHRRQQDNIKNIMEVYLSLVNFCDINHHRQQDNIKNIMEVYLCLVNFYDINHRIQQDNIKNIMKVYLGLVSF